MAKATKYQSEVDAIRALRDAFPNDGPKKLANRISERGEAFESVEHRKLADETLGRSVLSIYSVIRRHDAKKAKENTLAKKVKTALATV